MTYYLLMKDQKTVWHIVDMAKSVRELVSMAMKLLETGKQIQIISNVDLKMRKKFVDMEKLNLFGLFDRLQREIYIFPTKKKLCQFLVENYRDEEGNEFDLWDLIGMDSLRFYHYFDTVCCLEINGINWGEPFCV